MTNDDPNWPRASRWLAGEFSPADAASQLSVVGFPLNSSITPGRCDQAPAAIRTALQRFSLFDADAQVDLRELNVRDQGDLPVSGNSPEQSFAGAREALKRMTVGDHVAVVAGGDNGITRACVHAAHPELSRCGLITFDAHHDLRDLHAGLTNGNPIRALLADGLPGAHIVQIGIQPFANSPAYAAVARDAGIEVITADAIHEKGIVPVVERALGKLSACCDAICVDLDVDVLDRAFAPACPGSRPGGLAPWMLRQAARICGRHEKVRLMDIVEVDPTRDVADVTVLAAASFLLAFAAGVALRKGA